MLLDFLNEELPWRNARSNKMDDVRDIKAKCLADPERFLWRATANTPEVKSIFYMISKLRYSDKPDYGFIRGQLNVLLQKEERFWMSRSSETLNTPCVFLF